MFNNYPYTDFHELNLDWILNEMKALDARLDEALTTLSTQIYNRVMGDITPKLNEIRSDMTNLQRDFTALSTQFTELTDTFNAFTAYVNGRLDVLKAYVDSQTLAAYQYTNTRIEQNNEYILRELQQYLSQIKVINFFTGQLISVQDMFDYLASLHATDALDYDTMALRSKTYTQLAAFNKTYTELVMSGNTWYV